MTEWIVEKYNSVWVVLQCKQVLSYNSDNGGVYEEWKDGEELANSALNIYGTLKKSVIFI